MRARPLDDKVYLPVTVKVGHHSPSRRRVKSLIGAVPRSSSIAADDSKMIRRARTQATDVRNDVVQRGAGVILNGRAGTVVRRRSVLEMNGRIQSVRIDRAIERG